MNRSAQSENVLIKLRGTSRAPASPMPHWLFDVVAMWLKV